MMKQIKILFIITLIPLISIGQTKSVIFEFQIHEIVYKGDTLDFLQSKEIKLFELGCSEIMSIGKIKNNEIAIQLETFMSRIGQNERLLVGKAFYLKNGDKWELIIKPKSFWIHDFYVSENENEFQEASEGYGDLLNIAYSERYRIIK